MVLVTPLHLMCETKERTLTTLVEYSQEICQAANRFQVPPRLMVGAIFADRRLYYNMLDARLDVPVAKQGRDNSIGIAQLRVSTAMWICQELSRPESPYYVSGFVLDVVPCSTDRDSIIHSLNNPVTNLLFAAAYSAMILHRWDAAGYDISNNPAIFATLYNLGPYCRDGTERRPHAKPESNHFGDIAHDFYNSSLLRTEFPVEGSNP